MKTIKVHISRIKCQECGSKFKALPSDFEYVKVKDYGVIKTVICPFCNGRLKDELGIFGLSLWTCLRSEYSEVKK